MPATATIRGTEFTLAVGPGDSARLAVLNGLVEFSNPQGSVLVAANEQATVKLGEAPRKTVLLNPLDAVQWSLYYPDPVGGPAERARDPQSPRYWTQAAQTASPARSSAASPAGARPGAGARSPRCGSLQPAFQYRAGAEPQGRSAGRCRAGGGRRSVFLRSLSQSESGSNRPSLTWTARWPAARQGGGTRSEQRPGADSGKQPAVRHGPAEGSGRKWRNGRGNRRRMTPWSTRSGVSCNWRATGSRTPARRSRPPSPRIRRWACRISVWGWCCSGATRPRRRSRRCARRRCWSRWSRSTTAISARRFTKSRTTGGRKNIWRRPSNSIPATPRPGSTTPSACKASTGRSKRCENLQKSIELNDRPGGVPVAVAAG